MLFHHPYNSASVLNARLLVNCWFNPDGGGDVRCEIFRVYKFGRVVG